MSELRSAIEELQSEALADMPDARVEEDFDEVHRAAELLEVERLRRLADIDRRRAFERHGHLSTAAWLVAVYKMSWGKAREQVGMARALKDMPETRVALDSGEISTSALRVLVSAREADPEAFARCEGELVEAARIHPTNDLGRIAAYWRQAVQKEHGITDEDIRARRRLYASPTFMGMVRTDGDLDQECGEAFLTALQAEMDADVRSGDWGEDTRTLAQRRVDALHRIVLHYLDSKDRPSVAGERPHITLTVDKQTLRDGGGDICELDRTGPVDAETARRIACDAAITRVIMAGPSQPLDVGRTTPVITSAMHKALVVRDKGCRFPYCRRPPSWTDGHHVLHWTHEGGETKVDNLVLLCRRHHRMVHEGGFGVQMIDGDPVFYRPDGSVLGEDRAPP
jgi:hypothetical protein